MIPAVLVQKSTGEIIKIGTYPALPNPDGSYPDLTGLDPDLQWLAIYEPFVQPDYDPRVFMLVETKEILATTPHPVYANLMQYKITYSLVKKTNTEIEGSLVNAEQVANQSVFPVDKQLKLLTLSVAVLFRTVGGLTLNAKETAIKNKLMALAVKIWQNDSMFSNKKTALLAGQEVDIDSGWTNT